MNSFEDAPLLWVEWVDSVHYNGWTAMEELPIHDLNCRSVGWLIAEDEESITIIAHDGGKNAMGDMTIPKVAITGRWEITL